MAVAVYKNIVDGTNLFSRAPTGTGKTLAAIFPALKAMGEEKTEKIFYLTAKTIGRTVAENTIKILQNNGGDLRYCVITAKEKACLKEFALCEPEYCEYTVDYYKKQKKAIEYALDLNRWNYDCIKSIAIKYELCPFELSLGLSQYAEIVICDYNYAFEPNAHIKRHFDGLKHEYTFLIDEAHNLTDRAREMYSKEIDSNVLNEWINDFPLKTLKVYKKLVELYETVENIPPLDKDFFVLQEYPLAVIKLLDTITMLIERQLEKKNKAFLKFYLIKIYWQVYFILANIRSITSNHIIYYKRTPPAVANSVRQTKNNSEFRTPNSEFLLKVFCVNPKDLLAEYLKNAKSSTFFSATLHPFDYFCEIFAEKEKDNRLTLLSPFHKDKFGLYLYTGINTMYQHREHSYEPLADLIYQTCSVKKGNYIIYFPSFSFMKQVHEIVVARHALPINIITQTSKMKEKERESFLKQFDNQDQHMIAFCVIGGIFAEGIDLIGKKLIGCMIITVGIPGLGGENDLIKDYYEQTNHKGFEFAYRYPGFNNVMQAAGRVIRSEEDKGFVILVDQRFTKQYYLDLYPPDWQHFKAFSKTENLKNEIIKFWG
jgi:Rad3-related DNA helicase